LFVCLTRLFPF